jgi:hypothetical protein
MKLKIDLSEDDIRVAVKEYVEHIYGMTIGPGKATLTIEVKSKQNYKSEWENASYRGQLICDEKIR